jgi:hypothetical protein
MTAISSQAGRAIGSESLDDALAAVHDRWVPRLAAVLSPVMTPRSRFWERWEVTRRFADRFPHWLQMEFAVVEGIGGRLSPEARVRLATLQDALVRTGSELMSTRARQWNPGPPAMLSRRLLELTRFWCAELELATRGLTVDDLPQPCRAMLARMSAA